MSKIIDIKGLQKVCVLRALYLCSKKEYPEDVIDEDPGDDYFMRQHGLIGVLFGRPIYCNISGDTVDVTNYDKSNGDGAGFKAIATVERICRFKGAL